MASTHIEKRRLASLADLKTKNPSKVVSLTVESGLTSLDGIERFSGLRELLVGHTQIDSVEPLRTSTTLTFLNIEHTNVSDLTPLLELPRLERLMARGCPTPHVPPLVSLEMFFASDALEAPEELAKLVNLRVLRLPRGVSDVAFLRGLPELFNVDASRSAVTDITALADLPKLGMLSLRDTGVTDLSPLANLPELIDLRAPDGTHVRGKERIAEYLAGL